MPAEKDIELIAQAEQLQYTDWNKAFALAEQAESEQAKTRLENIGRVLFHTEEYYAGLD